MRLLVIRHGKAVDRDVFATTARDDSKRPLTRKGRERMIDAAGGLHALLPELALIATSPLVRAAQTARIIAEAYPGVSLVERHELTPDEGEESVIHWLRRRREPIVAIVGHEPDLSSLIGRLLKPGEKEISKLKKGAMCLIDFAGQCDRGAGTLVWLKSAKQLAREA